MSATAIPEPLALSNSSSLQAFFDNLDSFAELANGVTKLRELILELAVRGKLVEQDENDESAAKALSRIVAAKEKRGRAEKKCITNGTGKEWAPLAWNIPTGWTEAPLSDLVTVLNGRAYKKSELLDEGTPVLRVGNLFTSKHWYYSDLDLEPDKYCDEGDVIFAWSASFGPFIWPGPRAIYHYHIWKLDLHSEEDFDKHYLYRFLLYKTQAIKQAGHGVSMVHMTKQKMEKIAVPVPPLPEQRRIVSKVDELMSLCDKLESRRNERVSVRERANRSCLARLTSSNSRRELNDAWKRVNDHFEILYDTPETLADLRQSILQLAVQGKLVPQDPNDEPAERLLERVAQEKTRLVNEGEIPKPRTASRADGEVPYTVPSGWEWARLGDISLYIEAGWSPRCESHPRQRDEWGVLKISAVTWDTFNPNENKALPAGVEPRARCEVKAGDFVMSRANTAELVAKSVVIEKTPPRLMLNDKLLRVVFSDSVDKHYINLFNNCRFARVYYESVASGTSVSMRNVSRDNVASLSIPLPPLPEQTRIVAKVDHLLLHCDQLGVRLRNREATTQQLLTAAFHQVLDDMETQGA